MIFIKLNSKQEFTDNNYMNKKIVLFLIFILSSCAHNKVNREIASSMSDYTDPYKSIPTSPYNKVFNFNDKDKTSNESNSEMTDTNSKKIKEFNSKIDKCKLKNNLKSIHFILNNDFIHEQLSYSTSSNPIYVSFNLKWCSTNNDKDCIVESFSDNLFNQKIASKTDFKMYDTYMHAIASMVNKIYCSDYKKLSKINFELNIKQEDGLLWGKGLNLNLSGSAPSSYFNSEDNFSVESNLNSELLQVQIER